MTTRCGLCGHTEPEDHQILGGWANGVDLCHTDDHSCYHRWTVYGERPANSEGITIPAEDWERWLFEYLER